MKVIFCLLSVAFLLIINLKPSISQQVTLSPVVDDIYVSDIKILTEKIADQPKAEKKKSASEILQNNTNRMPAPPVNDNCAAATALTVGAPCVNGTTKEATVQAGETTGCQGAVTQTVWYSFVATSTTMFVEVERTASSGCYLSSAVYRGACLPTSILSCEDAAGGPNLNIHNLNSLLVGTTYWVQVSYTSGGVCGAANNAATGADFCIKVGVQVNCNTCSNPCGSICIFPSAPTVNQVLNGCTNYQLQSRLNAGQTRTQCYTFTAVSISFSLQMIISGLCSGGNVSSFNWSLYPSSCSGIIQSGNLSNMNATGLTIGAGYVLCYTWTAACQHNYVVPYMVATAPLPVELIHFSATQDKKIAHLKWSTASETNSHYFSIQRSLDGYNFSEIGQTGAAGFSNHHIDYKFTDSNPTNGINFYRLIQYDYDGQQHYSEIIGLKLLADEKIVMKKNVVSSEIEFEYYSDSENMLLIYLATAEGKIIYQSSEYVLPGPSSFNIPTRDNADGLYILKIISATSSQNLKIIKKNY